MFLLIKGMEEKINICNNNKEEGGGSMVGVIMWGLWIIAVVIVIGNNVDVT